MKPTSLRHKRIRIDAGKVDEPIVAWLSGEENVACQYGMVAIPNTDFHTSTGSRRCFHAVEEMPRVMLFGKEAILRVGTMPYCHLSSWPCILSRRDDVVTMAFDRTGTVLYCAHRPHRPDFVYRYRLLPMRWDDEVFPAENLLLGLRADA